MLHPVKKGAHRKRRRRVLADICDFLPFLPWEFSLELLTWRWAVLVGLPDGSWLPGNQAKGEVDGSLKCPCQNMRKTHRGS